MKINQLTPSEELLMGVLWKLNSAYMREIMSAYPEPKPHQNTVSTFIKILVEKDFVRTEKEGRIFKYTVAVPLEEYRKFLLKNFLQNYYDNSAADLIKTLMQEDLLQPGDVEIISGESIQHEKDEIEKEKEITYFIEKITSTKKKKKKKKKSKSMEDKNSHKTKK